MKQTDSNGTFAGKVVIVTGGAAGIGKGIVRCFAEEGASVLIADWNEEDGTAAREEMERLFGADIRFVKTDVSDPERIRRAAAEATGRWNRIDVLVNNVGTHYYRPLADISAADWDRLMATDLRGHFLMSQAVAPVMVEQGGGCIVHISSVHAWQTQPNFTAYAAAKGGIVAMTRAMALELAACGIRVNAVLPGLTRNKGTDAYLASLPEDGRADALKRAAANVPLGRMADPTEIGHAVAFLAGPKASFITGTCLAVDGGESAHLRW